MRLALHWLRRDLRLHDNTALAAATAEFDAVVPVYVVNPHILGAEWIAPARVAGLSGALTDLASQLTSQGGRLIVAEGATDEEVARLAATLGAEAVVANRGIGRFDGALEQRLAKRLRADGRRLALYDDVGIVPPDALLTGAGTPFTVYTPYARRWRESLATTPPGERRVGVSALRAGAALTATTTSIDHEAAFRAAGFDLDRWLPLHGGGRTAHLARLDDFLAGHVAAYREARNFPAAPGTSRLSPAFRWGTLSYREAWRAAQDSAAQHPQAASSIEGWIGELAWADFYRAVLQNFPQSQSNPFKAAYEHLVYPGDTAHFAAWQAGQTGYPIVDAGMRQLLAEGWMHNRLRMIVASFLVKDLLLDWRLGVLHFMQHLACGDTSANVGGWQWAASTGTDAQPYFRIFNPVTQSEKFDPEGAYIRRYVPELARIPARQMHAPWLLTAAEQQRAGCRIGSDYPAPIVDHAAQRVRALALYKAVAPAGE